MIWLKNVLFKDLSAMARDCAEILSARYGAVRAEPCRCVPVRKITNVPTRNDMNIYFL